MVRIAVIGDSVRDSWIEVESIDDLKGCKNIEQVLGYASKIGRIINNSFGGTALTWTQYLVPEHCVTPITIIGNDESSIELENVLKSLDQSLKQKHKPGLDFSGLNKIDGDLAKFVIAFSGKSIVKKGIPEWKSKIFWEGNVSDKYDQLNITSEFLGTHDVLALPIPHPKTALQAVKNFRSINPRGVICYNPGRYLTRRDYTFKDTCFEEIATETTYLVLNRYENGAVRKGLKLGRRESLFNKYPKLEAIILTKDHEGSEIQEKRSGKRYEPSIVNVIEANPAKSLGAGDAYAATWLSKILSGQSIDNALDCATRVAEHILGVDGAVDLRRLLNGDYHSPTVRVTDL